MKLSRTKIAEYREKSYRIYFCDCCFPLQFAELIFAILGQIRKNKFRINLFLQKLIPLRQYLFFNPICFATHTLAALIKSFVSDAFAFKMFNQIIVSMCLNFQCNAITCFFLPTLFHLVVQQSFDFHHSDYALCHQHSL